MGRPARPPGWSPRWVLRCSLGAIVAGLVLFALGFGLISSTLERRVVVGDAVAATAAATSAVATTASSAKGTAAVVTTSWSPVAIEVVFVVAALTAFVASARRTGSCWLRAPPVATA